MKGMFVAGGIECWLYEDRAKVGGLEESAFTEREIQDTVKLNRIKLEAQLGMVDEWLRLRKLSHPLPEVL